jgi:hypothetical protein
VAIGGAGMARLDPLNPRAQRNGPGVPPYTREKRGEIVAFPVIMRLYCGLDASVAGFSEAESAHQGASKRAPEKGAIL